jgi:hypothetical protein
VREQSKPKRHNAKLCPLVIRERIVNALAAGDSKAQIAKALRVSRNTVSAVAEQAIESKKIIKVGREYFLADERKMIQKPDHCFTLVSRKPASFHV